MLPLLNFNNLPGIAGVDSNFRYHECRLASSNRSCGWFPRHVVCSLPAIVDDLLEIACLFRAAAGQLRRLSKGPIRTKRDTIVAIEACLFKDQMKSEPAFPHDQCQETANLFKEFADKLEALMRSARQRA